jgi:hypothetical protein
MAGVLSALLLTNDFHTAILRVGYVYIKFGPENILKKTCEPLHTRAAFIIETSGSLTGGSAERWSIGVIIYIGQLRVFVDER